ncbi:MAG: hypothetical protein ACK48H_20340 [Microcystis sp.]|nr:hypothetical protein [Microcystis sp. LE19-10.1B]
MLLFILPTPHTLHPTPYTPPPHFPTTPLPTPQINYLICAMIIVLG